jgi:hypothetical protein
MQNEKTQNSQWVSFFLCFRPLPTTRSEKSLEPLSVGTLANLLLAVESDGVLQLLSDKPHLESLLTLSTDCDSLTSELDSEAPVRLRELQLVISRAEDTLDSTLFAVTVLRKLSKSLAARLIQFRELQHSERKELLLSVAKSAAEHAEQIQSREPRKILFPEQEQEEEEACELRPDLVAKEETTLHYFSLQQLEKQTQESVYHRFFLDNATRALDVLRSLSRTELFFGVQFPDLFREKGDDSRRSLLFCLKWHFLESWPWIALLAEEPRLSTDLMRDCLLSAADFANTKVSEAVFETEMELVLRLSEVQQRLRGLRFLRTGPTTFVQTPTNFFNDKKGRFSKERHPDQPHINATIMKDFASALAGGLVGMKKR